MAKHGIFWQQMTTYGNKWQLLATNGNFKQYIVRHWILWPHIWESLKQMAIFYNKWQQLLTTNGNSWHFCKEMAAFTNECQLLAIPLFLKPYLWCYIYLRFGFYTYNHLYTRTTNTWIKPLTVALCCDTHCPLFSTAITSNLWVDLLQMTFILFATTIIFIIVIITRTSKMHVALWKFRIIQFR